MICDMMGIPEADQDRMVSLTNRMLAPNEHGLSRTDLPPSPRRSTRTGWRWPGSEWRLRPMT